MSASPLARLHAVLDRFEGLALAVSGGVDSLTLATAAHRRAPASVEVFHAVSPAVPAAATARVRDLAAREGWRLQVLDAGEFADPSYRANPVDRCFFCKSSLYRAIRALTRLPIASGANRDDLDDYRPGLVAARDAGVHHPLLEAGLGKADVRALAAALGLGALAELPASPCLSSRLETGVRVEPALLALVEAVEAEVAALTGAGTVRCRVRAARLDVELEPAAHARLDAAARAALLDRVARRAAAHGVARPVTLAPYRRGSALLLPVHD